MRFGGVVLVVLMGVIHAIEAAEYFAFATYLGALFVANVAGAVLAAIGMLMERVEGWALGAVTAAVTFVAYIVSRTAGLPKLPPEETEFLEPLGIASLVIEAAIVVAFAVWAKRRRSAGSLSQQRPTAT